MVEYPKALYQGGIGSQFEELPYVVVKDAAEEKAQNAQGWFEIGKAPAVPAEPAEEAPKRGPGRPKKAE